MIKLLRHKLSRFVYGNKDRRLDSEHPGPAPGRRQGPCRTHRSHCNPADRRPRPQLRWFPEAHDGPAPQDDNTEEDCVGHQP
jgi:hypothetical protein